MDYLHHPFQGKRHTVFAKKGMVATSQPLAAQAGLDILKKVVMQLMRQLLRQQHLPL